MVQSAEDGRVDRSGSTTREHEMSRSRSTLKFLGLGLLTASGLAPIACGGAAEGDLFGEEADGAAGDSADSGGTGGTSAGGTGTGGNSTGGTGTGGTSTGGNSTGGNSTGGTSTEIGRAHV